MSPTTGTTATTPTTGGRRLRPRHGVIAVLVLLLVATVSVGLSPIGQRYLENADAAAPSTGVDEVRIVDSRFDRASISVPVGTTVTWRWTDGEEHDVVFDDGPASEVVDAGAWSRTFDSPGEHRYSCTLHAFMDGRVVVTDGTG